MVSKKNRKNCNGNNEKGGKKQQSTRINYVKRSCLYSLCDLFSFFLVTSQFSVVRSCGVFYILVFCILNPFASIYLVCV